MRISDVILWGALAWLIVMALLPLVMSRLPREPDEALPAWDGGHGDAAPGDAGAHRDRCDPSGTPLPGRPARAPSGRRDG